MIADQDLKSIITDAGLIPAEELQDAVETSNQDQRPLRDVLIERDLISDPHIGQLIAQHLNLQFVSLNTISIPEETLRIVPADMAHNLLVMCFAEEDTMVKVAMSYPDDLATIHLIEKKTGKTVQMYYATERDIKEATNLYKRGLKKEFATIMESHATSGEPATTSVVKMFDTIIQYAYQQKASDVHIEPTNESVVIRFRIDGILHDMVTIPKDVLEFLIGRIKVLAKLRTDEHRSAQDGKLTQKLVEEDLDVRVSVIPTAGGEKAVLRLLSSRSRQYALEDLGLGEHDISIVRKAIRKPHGMILVTGPTGSGKTTTLYAVLKILNRREVNISTIEDPVEYAIEGVNQIQVNSASNLTFAEGLRSIVRQDPDIIMIGEIRDEETADIAVNSAMTGHLVLSTLHTNDAATTLPRLLDLGVEPFLVASTIHIAIAQRLVRTICKQCVKSEIITGEALDELKQNIDFKKQLGKDPSELRFYRGNGCDQCNQTGYSGRLGVFEILEMSSAVRKLIMTHADSDSIRDQAIKDGMTTMFQDGLNKALLGITTIDEVMRVLTE